MNALLFQPCSVCTLWANDLDRIRKRWTAPVDNRADPWVQIRPLLLIIPHSVLVCPQLKLAHRKKLKVKSFKNTSVACVL